MLGLQLFEISSGMIQFLLEMSDESYLLKVRILFWFSNHPGSLSNVIPRIYAK